MASPVVLAIETSQRPPGAGVAVRVGEGAVEVELIAHGSGSPRHDDDLLPAIDRLFRRVGLAPADLSGGRGSVGVSVGPGGFTGLRIAVTTAKMFAEALGAAVVAVPSALVAAEHYEGDGPLVVALASKAETFWSAHLKRSEVEGAWRVARPPGIISAAELPIDEIAAVLADAHFPSAARARCEHAGVPVIEPVFDPAACLAVTERLLDAGERSDPLALTPSYPRPPEAVTIWERRHAPGL
jgi:tRNA threonylcarbamoyladenosine biosynthesis protein TsaB